MPTNSGEWTTPTKDKQAKAKSYQWNQAFVDGTGPLYTLTIHVTF